MITEVAGVLHQHPRPTCPLKFEEPAWAARRRLLTGHERLRPETFAKMWNSLIDTGDAGVQILQAGAGDVPQPLRRQFEVIGPGVRLCRSQCWTERPATAGFP